MGFVERYMRALCASNRGRDDGQAELLAAALAAGGAGELGSLLHRVKYADDLMRHPDNLAQLLRLWTAQVTRQGRHRRWVSEATSWDAQAAKALYRTVAELSLAHWIDGRCDPCGGTGQAAGCICRLCAGTGVAPIQHAGGVVRERVREMVSVLHDIAAGHARRAGARLQTNARAHAHADADAKAHPDGSNKP